MTVTWEQLRNANRLMRERDDSNIGTCDKCEVQHDLADLAESEHGNYCGACILSTYVTGGDA